VQVKVQVIMLIRPVVFESLILIEPVTLVVLMPMSPLIFIYLGSLYSKREPINLASLRCCRGIILNSPSLGAVS